MASDSGVVVQPTPVTKKPYFQPPGQDCKLTAELTALDHEGRGGYDTR